MICGAPYVSAWLREDQIVGGNTSSVSEETLHASHFTNTSYFNPNAEGVETDPTPSKIGVEMLPLTAYFFMLYFLMATQDIAVDGWALTMLSKDNVGYASVANAVGQTFGILISNQVPTTSPASFGDHR